jgi:hypothetical protein
MSLGDALEAKKETRASEGSEEAQQAAASGIDWDDVGRHAERQDEEKRPRRKQTNIDIPEDLKRRFKSQLQSRGLQMRFVLEDLIRLYLDRVG